MNDDAALLHRYTEDGSEAAFTELVGRHVDLVYGAALRRTGDPHRAADVAQQVFTNLARNARKLSRHSVLAAWLHTATRNAALNLMISEERRRARETEVLALEPVAPEGGTNPDWEKLGPLLDAAIDELPETDRAAVVLRFLQRRPFAEIGVALRTTEDAARMRTDRALDKLRVALARRGITSSAAALAVVVSGQPLVSAPAGLAATLANQSLAPAGGSVFAATLAAFMTTKVVGTAALVALISFGTGVYVGLRHDSDTPTVSPPALAPVQKQEFLADNRKPVAAPDGATQGFQTPKPVPATISSFKDLASEIPIAGGVLDFRPGPSDPIEARKAVRVANGQAFDQDYAELYQKLAFTQEQIDRFRELHLVTIDARKDYLNEMRKAQPELSDRQRMQTAVQEVVTKTNEVFLNQVAREFGEDVAVQVRDYQANGRSIR